MLDQIISQDKIGEIDNQNAKMAAYLAHEVRQPLYGLRALIQQQIVSGKPDLKKLQLCLNEMNQVIDFSTKLIDTIKLGTWEQNIRPVSVKDIRNEVEAILIPIADQYECKITLTLLGMRDLYLYVDQDLLMQLINNLAINSIKNVGENGKVDVFISVVPKEEYRVNVEVRVQDNGRGMSEEFLKIAQTPFEQENVDESDLLQGNGVGLYIVKQIAHTLKATMKMDSKVNKGTNVTVRFEADASEEYYEKKVQKKSSKEVDSAFLNRKKILVAENNELYMDLVVDILEKNGAIVDKTYDGNEVVDLFEDSGPQEYQAIIMDLQMPEKDGVDATDEIRNMERSDAKTVPILAFTGYPIKDEKDFLDAHKMQGSIPKVFEEIELLNILCEVLS